MGAKRERHDTITCRDVKQVPIDQLALHPNEQQCRLTDAAMRGLISDIKATGLVTPIVVAKNGHGYLVIDGNRRLTAATHLGIQSVWAQIIESTLTNNELFVLLNSHMRNMNGRERLNFVATAEPKMWDRLVELFPKGWQRQLRMMESALGREETRRIGIEGRYGPNLTTLAIRLQVIFSRKGIAVTDGQILRWMIAHRGTNVVNGAIRSGKLESMRACRGLAAAIESGRSWRAKV